MCNLSELMSRYQNFSSHFVKQRIFLSVFRKYGNVHQMTNITWLSPSMFPLVLHICFIVRLKFENRLPIVDTLVSKFDHGSMLLCIELHILKLELL